MSHETQPLLSSDATVAIRDERSIAEDNLSEGVHYPTGSVVTCRICQADIDISTKRDHHVVKCELCNEATPIRHPPPGKKYVRCPCNCLLICRSMSQRILCPRPNCKRIINLTPTEASQIPPAGMARIVCTHCRDTFLFSTTTNSLARCPHCRKLSAIGSSFHSKGFIFIGLGVCKAILAIALLATIPTSVGLIIGCVFSFLLAGLCFTRAIYCFTMPKSTTEVLQL